MRRLPRRKGISLGTVTMLAMTGIVIFGCLWLFPRLAGKVDLQINAEQLAVAIDSSLNSLGEPATRKSAQSDTVPTAAPVLASVETQPVLVTKPTTLSFGLTATGSICISSAVQKALTDQAGYQFSTLFEALQGEVRGDLAIATLENTAVSTEKLTDNNLPTEALTAIHGVGFNALCLGYYDVFSSGVIGLSATKDAARAAGMTPYGVYATKAERDSLCLTDVNGVSVALLSYQSDLSAASKKKLSKDEIAFAIAPPTLPTITADIQTARSAGAQVVVVSLCWGKEGSTAPSQTQRELAQGIANAGADVILGTHSGALQTIEVLTAKRQNGQSSQTLCAYSLGNLFTPDREKRTGIAGILLHAQVVFDVPTQTVHFEELAYTPTYVWRGKENDKTLYRVLPSDIPPPAFVAEDQASIMARCLTLVQEMLKDTAVKQRDPHEVTEGG